MKTATPLEELVMVEVGGKSLEMWVDPELREADEDVLAMVYRAQSEQETDCCWRKADVALEVYRRQQDLKDKGIEKDIVTDFCKEADENPKTFKNVAWVGGKIQDRDLRAIKLHWGKWKIIAGTHDPAWWAKECYAHNWTIEQLKTEIDKAKQKVDHPDGLPCQCGCGLACPDEKAPYVGNVDKKRWFFASLACLAKYCQAMVLVTEITAPAEGDDEQDLMMLASESTEDLIQEAERDDNLVIDEEAPYAFEQHSLFDEELEEKSAQELFG